MKLTALLTSHDRRERTVACLQSFYSQRLPPSWTLDAVLVDDGSSDGTQTEVRRKFPETRVARGSGDLYWAAGMALAERIARAADPDYLLWLNDDVVLDEDAVARLLQTEEAGGARPCIAVGALRDPTTGVVTYGGARRRGLHPLQGVIVEPGAGPLLVEMFHGNTVLVSRAAFNAVGPIDGGFSHAAADFDYGLRARRIGVASLLAPESVGTCSRDGMLAPWLDGSLSAAVRLRLLLGRKGLPPRSTARYLRRHGGTFWLAFWVAPYLRFVGSLLRPPRADTGE